MGHTSQHPALGVVFWHFDELLMGLPCHSLTEQEALASQSHESSSVLGQLRDTMTRLRHRAVPQYLASDLPPEGVLSRLRQSGTAHYFQRILAGADISDFVERLEPSRGADECLSRVADGNLGSLVVVGDHVPEWATVDGISTVEVGAGSTDEVTRQGSARLVGTQDLAALLGVSGGEQDLDDPEFERLYGVFAGRTPEDVSHFMDGFAASWYVASGWALEAFSGVSRVHHDIDVCIQRSDLEAFQQHCAGRYDLWSASAGALKPFRVGDDEAALLPGSGQLWVRASATAQWEFDVLLCPGDGSEWICTRDESIRLGADDAWWRRGGVRYLAPQAALLMKAKLDRPQDRADLESALPKMTSAQTHWLAANLERLHPGHNWLPLLR